MHPGHSQGSPANAPPASFPRVLIATTAMLSFISFWRAAAIVLNDLASSAYYAGGIAEKAIGKAAPWFILAIMLFSYAVRAINIERDRKSTRLNSSHGSISYAVFCLKKKNY